MDKRQTISKSIRTKQAEDAFFAELRKGNYRIHSSGDIFRKVGSGQNISWKKLEPRVHKGKKEYISVRVKVRGKSRTAQAHRIVYRYFYGPIPPGWVVNHKDGRKWNNSPGNLEAITQSANVRHAKDVLKVGPWNKKGTARRMKAVNGRKKKKKAS